MGSSVSLVADPDILVSEQEKKYLHCEHGVRLLYRVFGNLEDSDLKKHTLDGSLILQCETL